MEIMVWRKHYLSQEKEVQSLDRIHGLHKYNGMEVMFGCYIKKKCPFQVPLSHGKRTGGLFMQNLEIKSLIFINLEAEDNLIEKKL